MKAVLSFMLLGLLTAVPGEILNQVMSRRNPGAFWTTLGSYSVLLFLGFFTGKLILHVIKSRARAALAQYLLFGSLGLSVEWFLLGNAPVLDLLQLVVQPGMFTYWGTMLLAPRLLQEPAAFARLKRAFGVYFAAFSTLYLLVAGLLPRAQGGIFLGFIIFSVGNVGLNYYYGRYFAQLHAQDHPDTLPDPQPTDGPNSTP
jgi:hypothetical protein